MRSGCWAVSAAFSVPGSQGGLAWPLLEWTGPGGRRGQHPAGLPDLLGGLVSKRQLQCGPCERTLSSPELGTHFLAEALTSERFQKIIKENKNRMDG